MAADAAMGGGDDDEADDRTVDVGHEAANEAGSSGVADVVISVGGPVLYIEAQLVRANRETEKVEAVWSTQCGCRATTDAQASVRMRLAAARVPTVVAPGTQMVAGRPTLTWRRA
jgi:hypothetical protein